MKIENSQEHHCQCGTVFEYDSENFSVNVFCPNCNTEFYLTCEQSEPEYEHVHFLERER